MKRESDFIMADVFYRESRDKEIDFTCPYQVAESIVVRGPLDPSIQINSIDDINSPQIQIAVIAGTTEEDLATRLTPRSKKTFVTSPSKKKIIIFSSFFFFFLKWNMLFICINFYFYLFWKDQQYAFLNQSLVHVVITSNQIFDFRDCPSCRIIPDIFLEEKNYLVIGTLQPKDYTLAIVLGVILPILFLSILALGIFFYLRKKKKPKKLEGKRIEMDVKRGTYLSQIKILERLGEGQFADGKIFIK